MAKYRLLLIASIVLAALSVVLQLYVPVLFGSAIDGIIAEGAVDFDSCRQNAFAVSAFLPPVSALAAYVMNLVNNHMTYRVVEDLRLAAIKRLQKLPLSYLDSHSTGRYCQPCDCRPLDAVRRAVTRLYAAVFGDRDHRRDARVHVFQKRMGFASRDAVDAAKLFCGEIRVLTLVPYVPQTKRGARPPDGSHRRNDRRTEDRAFVRL